MITVSSRATRYQQVDQPVTVATPSCCCCCCCCLAAAAGMLTFTGVEVAQRRKRFGGSWISLLLAVLSLPAAVTAGMYAGIRYGNANRGSGWAAYALGAAVWFAVGAALYVLAHRSARSLSNLRPVVTFVTVSVAFAATAVVEVLVTLFTFGIAWLFTVPTAIWAAVVLGKRVGRGPVVSEGTRPYATVTPESLHPGGPWEPPTSPPPLSGS